MGGPTRRSTCAVAIAVALAGAGSAATPVSPCGDARFVFPHRVPLLAQHPSPYGDALTITGKELRLDSGCRSGRLRRVRKGVLAATLRGCGRGTGPLHVRLVLDPGCASLSGRVRFGARGAPVPFVAIKTRCGDDRPDAQNGEACDGVEGCALDEECGRDCHCRAIPPVTTTTLGPRCGDGIVNGEEQCDVSLFPGDCAEHGFDGGLLACAADCTLDTSQCTTCGNGVVEPGEACDGDDVQGASCLHGGVMRCGPTCRWLDDSGCFACGNGRREGSEECDGSHDFGGLTCADFDAAGGSLDCTGACTIDSSACWRCGNGRNDPGEECDDGNTTSGDGCGATCDSECGDGVIQFPAEQCDDGNTDAFDGCSFCYVADLYDGGGDEPWDRCGGTLGVQGATAGAAVACADGTPACDLDETPGTCTIRYFVCVDEGLFVGPMPPCLSWGARAIEVVGASLAGPAALAPAERGALLANVGELFEHFGPPGVTVTIGPTSVTADPPVTRGFLCANATTTMAVGESRAIAIDETDAASPAHVDHDEMTLSCTE